MTDNNSGSILEKTFSFNYAAGIAAVALVLGIIISYSVLPATGLMAMPAATDTASNGGATATCDATPPISEADLTAKAETHLEGLLALQGLENPDVKVISMKSYSDNLNEAELELYDNGELLDTFAVYLTKDGKHLVQAPLDLDEELPEPETAAPAKAAPEVAKTETPNVKMFVMTFCPYGQQAEAGLGPALEALGNTVDFEPHFVIYDSAGYAGVESQYCLDDYCSMHGRTELEEGVRQLCIFKYNKDKFWDYVNYVNANCSNANIDSCWETAAEAAGLDSDEIQGCYDEEAETLLANEVALNEKFGVRGSPSVFINDVAYSGGRSPENYKSGICGAYLDAPEACEVALSDSASASTGDCG